jgi:hypothetical protein
MLISKLVGAQSTPGWGHGAQCMGTLKTRCESASSFRFTIETPTEVVKTPFLHSGWIPVRNLIDVLMLVQTQTYVSVASLFFGYGCRVKSAFPIMYFVHEDASGWHSRNSRSYVSNEVHVRGLLYTFPNLELAILCLSSCVHLRTVNTGV